MTDLVIEEIDDADLARTWPVMSELRPHLNEAEYRAMVTRMRVSDGFRVFTASRDGVVVGVAGVRPMELLYCGRILQIDDLVVRETERSGGVGKALLDYVKAEARTLGAQGYIWIQACSERTPIAFMTARASNGSAITSGSSSEQLSNFA